jgi:hypothetical protein
MCCARILLFVLQCAAYVRYIAVAVTIAKLNYASTAAIHQRPPINVRVLRVMGIGGDSFACVHCAHS